MALQVIGAGIGRTGTLSLKYALEKLGYVKTYHMMELFQDPSRVNEWETLARKEEPNYDRLFEGYTAAVDFPPALYYKEFMKKYPDAKVILTVRDAEKWYKSASDTIFKAIFSPAKRILLSLPAMFSPKLRGILRIAVYIQSGIFRKMFPFGVQSKEQVIEVFNKWNEEVIRNVPAEKLLVFNVKDGWAPLCAFLNKPIPAENFPKVNSTEEFNSRRR